MTYGGLRLALREILSQLDVYREAERTVDVTDELIQRVLNLIRELGGEA